jgi:cytochrome c-type biogenesis protein CcmH/NrfF
MMFILLISVIDPVLADEDMTSDLICPCECSMVISTCDCTTATQVKKEITEMKEKGFSQMQIFSALQTEYGKEILAPQGKNRSSKLWVTGAALSFLLVFLGYIFSRKTKMDIIPDTKKYEQQFEEEYRNFVSEIDEPNKIVNYVSNTSNREDKQ